MKASFRFTTLLAVIVFISSAAAADTNSPAVPSESTNASVDSIAQRFSRKVELQFPELALTGRSTGAASSVEWWPGAENASIGFFLRNNPRYPRRDFPRAAGGPLLDLHVTIARYTSAGDAQEAVERSLAQRPAVTPPKENYKGVVLYRYASGAGNTICQAGSNVIEIATHSEGARPLTMGVLDVALGELGFALGSDTVQARETATNGLRMAISPAVPGVMTRVEFQVAFQNVGEKDILLNLGSMLANGKVQLPNALRLMLTDPKGETRDLQFTDRKHAGVAGRVDDFIVPLRAGAAYTLRLSLDQFVSTDTKEFELRLSPGRYRIAAVFDGRSANSVNLDMKGVALMDLWKGTMRSGWLDFEVSDKPAK